MITDRKIWAYAGNDATRGTACYLGSRGCGRGWVGGEGKYSLYQPLPVYIYYLMFILMPKPRNLDGNLSLFLEVDPQYC